MRTLIFILSFILSIIAAFSLGYNTGIDRRVAGGRWVCDSVYIRNDSVFKSIHGHELYLQTNVISAGRDVNNVEGDMIIKNN